MHVHVAPQVYTITFLIPDCTTGPCCAASTDMPRSWTAPLRLSRALATYNSSLQHPDWTLTVSFLLTAYKRVRLAHHFQGRFGGIGQAQSGT